MWMVNPDWFNPMLVEDIGSWENHLNFLYVSDGIIFKNSKTSFGFLSLI